MGERKTGKQFVVRHFDAVANMEIFFVAAVTSVLTIRLFLEVTGYPQIGGGGLHIAHMLWGGVLMLAAVVIQLCLIGKSSERLAALIGGIGFGTFIDEIGKFITSDNDYFFRPAISLIYLFFVLIFLLMRTLHTRQQYTSQEYMLNAMRLIEEIIVRDLDERERRDAELYLRRSGFVDELSGALTQVLRITIPTVSKQTGLLEKIKTFVARLYRRIARTRWFPPAVVAFFIGQLGIKLLYAFILVFIVGLGWNEVLNFGVFTRIVERFRHLTFVDVIEISFSLLSGVFVLWGVVRMRQSRLLAYKWFERSIMVSILITQVFAFYTEQFTALFGLLLNVAVLIALRFCAEQERAKAKV